LAFFYKTLLISPFSQADGKDRPGVDQCAYGEFENTVRSITLHRAIKLF
jgi:hypothetical protein